MADALGRRDNRCANINALRDLEIAMSFSPRVFVKVGLGRVTKERSPDRTQAVIQCQIFAC